MLAFALAPSSRVNGIMGKNFLKTTPSYASKQSGNFMDSVGLQRFSILVA